MSALLALTLAAALYEPANPNAGEFAQTGYVRAPITAADRKIDKLPAAIAEWNGAAWWQALTWCSVMHGVQKLRLEKAGAPQAALLEQQKLNQTYIDLAMARLVADRHVTLDQAWENFGEAEDAYWTYAYMYQPLNYEREAMTCRLFQTRVARL
ncbi:hypothetical protein [Caulobacter sp. NIBR1757]|uniref:hypothetical protein n=1 Tax=Caulobacter sp. NIBR1757 TaxID=3016000 RepID=UPI0022F11D05|nr:hypothetical protein [Caulobacter sp. NIBR1757]WGM38722.1 hypothetical protein AMEJIAPC_01626 [Caulobacter sp. NIBR1757]